MQFCDLGTIMHFDEIEFKYVRNEKILKYLKLEPLEASKIIFY